MLSGLRRWALLVLIACLALRSGILVSAFITSMGWLKLSQAKAYASSQTNASWLALGQFERAISTESSNRSAFLGAGIASVDVGEDVRALAYWQEGQIDPRVLIRLGIATPETDDALTYFRGAANTHAIQPNEGKYLAGQVCQTTLQSDGLSLSSQRFCQDQILQNGGNLVLNGQFMEGTTWGWSGQFFFADPASSSCSVDWAVGVPAPSLSVSGFDEALHRGLYQRLALRPGTEVRFSARFRYYGQDLDARLLYVEWEHEGSIFGNHTATTAHVREDWTYLERIFKLPNGAEPWAQFYPASIRGQGDIWIDDVRLERLAE